jgi:hypothetical protein
MRTLLVILALILVVSMSANSQVVTVTKNILAGSHLHSAAGDSLASLSVGYDGNVAALQGTYPDSIHVQYYGTDSTVGKIYFKGTWGGGTYARDSVGNVSTTTASTWASNLIARTKYLGADKLGVAYVAGSGSGVLSTHKVWVRLMYFFHLP